MFFHVKIKKLLLACPSQPFGDIMKGKSKNQLLHHFEKKLIGRHDVNF